MIGLSETGETYAVKRLGELLDYIETAPVVANTQFVGSLLHKDIVWTFPKGAGPVVGGEHRGIAEIGALLTRIFTEFYKADCFRFERHGFFGNEFQAVVRYSVTAVTAGGNPYRNDYALVAELKDGLIIRLDEFFDTSLAAKQMRA